MPQVWHYGPHARESVERVQEPCESAAYEWPETWPEMARKPFHVVAERWAEARDPRGEAMGARTGG